MLVTPTGWPTTPPQALAWCPYFMLCCSLVVGRSAPPHVTGGLAQHDAVEQVDGTLEAFVARGEDVLVLDAQRAVVTGHPQRGDDVAPRAFAVAVADRPERPGPVGDAVVGLGVQDAVATDVLRVDGGVLGVGVDDGAGQLADGRDRVDALPHEMAGVEVRADPLAGRLAQPQERLGV